MVESLLRGELGEERVEDFKHEECEPPSGLRTETRGKRIRFVSNLLHLFPDAIPERLRHQIRVVEDSRDRGRRGPAQFCYLRNGVSRQLTTFRSEIDFNSQNPTTAPGVCQRGPPCHCRRV